MTIGDGNKKRTIERAGLPSGLVVAYSSTYLGKIDQPALHNYVTYSALPLSNFHFFFLQKYSFSVNKESPRIFLLNSKTLFLSIIVRLLKKKNTNLKSLLAKYCRKPCLFMIWYCLKLFENLRKESEFQQPYYRNCNKKYEREKVSNVT